MDPEQPTAAEASGDGSGAAPGLLGLVGLMRPHLLPMLNVGGGSVIGAACAFAFQIISARALGPEGFGLLAAFLGILSAVGLAASALQNTVAVATAETRVVAQADAAPGRDGARRRRVPEAVLIGGAATILLILLSHPLAIALHTTPAIVWLTALTALPTLLLAERVGVLQGAHRTAAAIWSSSAAQLARVGLGVVSWLAGWAAAGMLGAVVAAVVIALVLAAVQARSLPTPRYTVLSGIGRRVLLLSALWAWVANADVIILRAGASPLLAGHYASAAVLAKASLIVPASLAFYLLPRFVSNRDNPGLTGRGQRLVMALTLGVGLLVSLVFTFAGTWIGVIAFGSDYSAAGELLLPLSLAFIPWLVAQSVLIRITAEPSRAAILLLLALAVVQVPAILATVGNVGAVILAQGIVGVVGLGGLLMVDHRLNRTR